MEFSMKNFWDGSRRALARAITIVEDERDGWEDIMKEIYHHTGRAQVIGITGAPGAGKSTLSDALIKQYRKQGKKVGIVAIDPTSPFSGGAILGDRIRMNDLTLDEGVYIRSMGTRGSLGGLSRKTDGCFRSRCHFHRNSRRRAVRSRYRQECGYNTCCARTRTG